jgi:hypothetical protein
MTMDHERAAQAPGHTSPSRDEAHTPIIIAPPWDYDADDLGVWINSSAHPQPIAKMGACALFDAKSHAAIIVRAVNSHADMLAALKSLLEMPSACSKDDEVLENNRRRAAASVVVGRAEAR